MTYAGFAPLLLFPVRLQLVLRLTQDGLACRISVSRRTINVMEAGKCVPSTVRALKPARVFGKPAESACELEGGG